MIKFGFFEEPNYINPRILTLSQEDVIYQNSFGKKLLFFIHKIFLNQISKYLYYIYFLLLLFKNGDLDDIIKSVLDWVNKEKKSLNY